MTERHGRPANASAGRTGASAAGDDGMGAGSTGRSGTSGDRTGGRGLRGTAPRGMWWVAWRQHRLTVLIAVAVMAAIAVALLVFRLVLVARMHGAGCTDLLDSTACPPPGQFNVFDEDTWRLLRGVMVGAPIVLGVFVGAPIFPREFEQRTHVFALTQSVGRIRWWAVKVTVAGAPLLAGLLALGFFQQWCDSATWFTARGALDDGTFQVRGIIPAAYGLLALAVAVTAGILIRSVTGALVAALIVAGAGVILIAFPLRSHLLPVTRNVTPVAAVQSGPGTPSVYTDAMKDGWYIGSGTLNAAGHVVTFDQNKCTLPPPPSEPATQTVTADGGALAAQPDPAYDKALNEAFATCRQQQGITAYYTDYLPASMAWPLRGVETGICAALAALLLALGAWRLRAAPRAVR